MKAKTALLILAAVALVCVVFLVVLLAGIAYLFSEQPPTVARDSYLEVPLGGVMLEVPSQDPFSLLLTPDASNLWDLRRAIHAAAEDDRIRGIYLEVQPLLMSWAQIEEVRDMLATFKTSGKPIHCLLAVDMAGESELYAASLADSITLNPAAGLIVDGLVAEVTFMKRTLDKLGIKPQFLQLKEFKSPETDSRREMTPEFKAMLTSILDDIHERFITAIATDRGLDAALVEEAVNTGMLHADQAIKVGLVDQLAYRSDVRSTLGSETGENYRSIRLKKYLEGLGNTSGSGGSKIAVVSASGMIIAGKSEPFAGLMGGSTMAARLRELREDKSIDGVLLRVNSPGGSAVGSEMIWHEVELLEESGTPVVVSMSDVAGSGGYYISMGAAGIVSQPSTITGSIGVIFGKYDLSGLYDWLGMDIDRIQTAPNADLLSLTSSLSPQQVEQVEAWMEAIYETFVRKAAEGRGVSYDELEPKAHGRIYTGVQALEAGLVDRIGGFDASIDMLREQLGLADDAPLRLELYPRPKTVWEVLASGDLFETMTPAAALRLASESLRRLETPGPWLIGPEVRIH